MRPPILRLSMDIGNLQDDLQQPWKLKWGYTQISGHAQVSRSRNVATVYTQAFEYAQAFGSPTRATYRCLDPQPGLHTHVWSPKRATVQVAISLCLEAQSELATCRMAFRDHGNLNGATHRCLEIPPLEIAG